MTNIIWRDGLIVVGPVVPPSLYTKLRYWHRDIGKGKKANEITGRYVDLYKKDTVDNDGIPGELVYTMPGFLHTVVALLRDEGIEPNIIDKRTPYPKPDIHRAMLGLRDYQQECVFKALKSGGGIIKAPTGYGKTHVIAAIINGYSYSDMRDRATPITVVACPSVDLTRKNYADLKELLPDRSVGILTGTTKRASDDIIVSTYNSLNNILPEDVGIFIGDEVHTASSESRADMISEFKLALKWGVSATPKGRFDGRDKVTEGLFGPIIYESTYQESVDTGALVPIKVYWIECPEPPIGADRIASYTSRVSKYRHGIWRNKYRNAIIGSIISSTDDNKQLLCIMQFIEQMNAIIPYCPANTTIVHAETTSKISSEFTNIKHIPAKLRSEIYDDMRDKKITKILSTHVYKQGVNFPELEIVINAGGGGSDIVTTQISGRESRKTKDKDYAILIDFWHPWDYTEKEDGTIVPGMIHRDDQSRSSAYSKLGFEQVWLSNASEITDMLKAP